MTLSAGVPLVPLSLVRRWWLAAAVYLAVICLIFWLLRGSAWGFAGRWLPLALAVGTAELLLLRRHLPHNVRPGETAVLPTLGLGNAISVGRGLCLALLAGFLFSPQPWGALGWFPVLLYTAADLMDALDGFAARRTGHMTRLGETLDMEYDALGMGIIVLLAIGYGTLPLLFLSVALARYLFILGLWWRARRGRPVYDLPPSGFRRTVAGYLMGMLSVALWPIVPPDVMTLGGSVYLVLGLLGFGRDWLLATGRLNPQSAHYRVVRSRLRTLVFEQLPLLLRPVIALLLITEGIVPLAAEARGAWVALFQSWALPLPETAAVALAAYAFVCSLLVLLGVQARWAALCLILPTAVHAAAVGLTLTNGLLLVCVLLLALTNSGRFSLWRPRERWALVPPGKETHG